MNIEQDICMEDNEPKPDPTQFSYSSCNGCLFEKVCCLIYKLSGQEKMEDI